MAHSILGIPLPRTKKEKTKLRRMTGKRKIRPAMEKEAEGIPRGWYARIEVKEENAK